MKFHHALVDDLVSAEEFEQRVAETVENYGDLVDETTAAMMVVTALGRAHVPIRGLSSRSSLFCFFGKVIVKEEPHEFDRKEGGKGLVVSLIVGDETGQARLVLWDEKAAATQEIDVGDVLEIIGRHAGKNPLEITVLALRKAACDIRTAQSPDPGLTARPERVNLDAVLVAVDPPRPYTRRDGSAGMRVEGVIGDAEGTARLVCWDPSLLEGITPPASLRFDDALSRPGGSGREYSIDERSRVTVVTGEPAPIPVSRICDIGSAGTASIRGEITRLFPPRTFTRPDGSQSSVRNIMVDDGTGVARVSLWAEKAACPLLPGDQVAIYHSRVKEGHQGGWELAVGGGAAVVLATAVSPVPLTREGTVIVTTIGTYIDNGAERFLVDTPLPHGHEIRAEGFASGSRLAIQGWEEAPPDVARVRAAIDRFLAGTGR